MCKVKDMEGLVFGNLKVLEQVGFNKYGKAIWKCVCNCNNVTNVEGGLLRNGDTRSCGCLQRKRVKDSNTKHGLRRTRLYQTWSNMKTRCYNHNYHGAEYYIDKGIKVCDEWLGFVGFKEWALNNGYKDNLTIDRIDNNGNYEPNNCQWLTLNDNARKAAFTNKKIKKVVDK